MTETPDPDPTMSRAEAADLLVHMADRYTGWTERERKALFIGADRARLALARATPAVAEVLTSAEAAQLPVNSIVVECYADGQPVHGYMPHVVRKNKQRDAPDGDVRVLYRAPEPTITVGQTITTAAELDACPVGTVLLSEVASRAVHVLMTYGWSGAGSDGEWAPALPARVLDLGPTS